MHAEVHSLSSPFSFYFMSWMGWERGMFIQGCYCMSHFFSIVFLQKFASNNHTVVQRESVAKLQKHLETIVSSLPVDLQTVIKT